MDSYAMKGSCLCSDPHDDDISDPVLHYMGCLPFDERLNFFDISNPLWHKYVTPPSSDLMGEEDKAAARALVEEKLSTWSRAVEERLDRIKQLRLEMGKDDRYKPLGENLHWSLFEWRISYNRLKSTMKAKRQDAASSPHGQQHGGGTSDTSNSKRVPLDETGTATVVSQVITGEN